MHGVLGACVERFGLRSIPKIFYLILKDLTRQKIEGCGRVLNYIYTYLYFRSL